MSADPDVSEVLKIAVASHYSQLALTKWQEFLLGQELNWYALAKLSNAWGLSPVLYDRVRQTPSLAIPIETTRLLATDYQATATFNLLALHELTKILDALMPLKIPVVLLKGIALLHSVYDNYAFRPMFDLDLLIQFKHLEQIVAALTIVGYQQLHPEPFHNYQGLFWNEVLLVNSGPSKMQVELHWNLVDNPHYARKLKTEKLIARCRIKHEAGYDLLLLAPDDQILHLCIHNAYHHQNRLQRSLVDIAFVANHFSDEINWDRLANSAIANDMTLAVATNLTLAANEWFAPVPMEILQHLEKTGIEIRERFYFLGQRSEFLKLGRTLITLPGLKSKIFFILGQLFPDRDFMVWRYGNGSTRPTIVLYLKRYASGLRGLIFEVIGRPRWLVKKRNNTKTPV
ncbi:MAG TPA: nucleotidyltransferase family protein [Patescibacteria group bacterium]|nr:nucleotidyltransferase family protein [Patescibacteria group bacterium]